MFDQTGLVMQASFVDSLLDPSIDMMLGHLITTHWHIQRRIWVNLLLHHAETLLYAVDRHAVVLSAS